MFLVLSRCVSGWFADSRNRIVQARCRFFLDSFFPQLTILYHYLFRMKKSIEVSVEWLKAPKYARHPRGKAIEHTGMAMIDCRKKFCKPGPFYPFPVGNDRC